ncbi:peptidylprolyl isomerase [Sediminibacter sp. Hel_I_10]|uniref:peptidylprolyl isomerase n=1 Tax=Sediminibacter sp. Hel_I_10 TaxID=1392490 RepID=UPI000690E481|nr:peptidylprolyl isomerase [Sediminibacter sp. Hel_I_10]
MKSIFTAICFCFGLLLFAQDANTDVLFTIDNEPVKASEFIRVYSKNLDLVKDETQKDIDAYLKLFVDYKLKVKEARQKGLDQENAYIREFGNYQKQLTKNYMTDNEVTDQLVKEAYDRSIQDVKASHVLIRIDENETDTTEVYKQLMDLRERVINEGYEPVQKAVHNGKTIFAEDLGYFSAFKMVYPFETAAYQTEVGEVSMPFRTRFGFHIVKVWDKRKSLGQVTVAHIMVADQQKDSTLDPAARIKQIYTKLQQGEKFESLAKQFSDDKSSASKGGVLNPFSGGQLSSKEFEEKAFSLENKGDVTAPFKTDYGWHIVKLIDKKGVQPFSEVEGELQNKVKQDMRSKLISSAMTAKLKDQYGVKDNTEALKYFETIITDAYFKRAWTIPSDLDLEKPFLKIKDTTYVYDDFANHLFSVQRNYVNKKLSAAQLVNNEYDVFLTNALTNYKETHLESENEEFAHILNEYREGLLLFDLMENEVWNKATKDSVGLAAYYDAHQSEYLWNKRAEGTLFSSASKKEISKVRKQLKKGKTAQEVVEGLSSESETSVIPTTSTFEKGNRMLPDDFKLSEGVSDIFDHNDLYHVLLVDAILPAGKKTLEEARGQVVSAYQSELENEWIETLRAKYKVKVNQDVLEETKSKLNK